MEEMYHDHPIHCTQAMYQMDSQTLKDIVGIAETLREHIKWYLHRNDVEVVDRLFPTMNHLQQMIISIYCGKDQTIQNVITPIETGFAELRESWRTAETQEEKQEMEKLISEYIHELEFVMKNLATHVDQTPTTNQRNG